MNNKKTSMDTLMECINEIKSLEWYQKKYTPLIQDYYNYIKRKYNK